MNISDTTIEALISLLEDQDELVYKTVKEKLLTLGPPVIPFLEASFISANTSDHLVKIEEIIAQLKRKLLKDQLNCWIRSETRTLLEGWLIVSSIHHPNISKDRIENSLQKIYREVWLEISDSMTSLEKIAVINHTLFRVNNFEIVGNENSNLETILLDKLLFSKVGDIYSLTMLYLIIARNIHVELLPIMLANKLLLVYEDNLAATLAYGNSSDKYLFYINVGHRGSVISPKEVQFLYDKSQKYANLNIRIESDVTLIKRLLSFMYLFYSTEGEEEKLLITEDLLSLLDGN